jgi:4-amino-4-deoxy-L-arabinose transferase-like glycosyltransferase
MLSLLYRKYSSWVDMALIALVAIVMRVWGIGFDLPNLYHRDEARYVSIPLSILKTGDYNPHFFNYPTLFFYLLSAAYIVYFLFMASRGRVGNLDGLVLPEQVLENVVGRANMPSQFLVGRGMVAMSGVLTILLVYCITRKAYSRRAGLLAALLLSVSPTHIRNSHFVAPDVSMILFVVASFTFTYAVWTGGKLRDYLLAGLLAGLAISTKYNAYPILAPLILAHVAQRQGRLVLDREILVAAAACSVGFLLGTPYALLDLPAFLNGLAFELRHYATMGDPGTEGQNALVWYVRYLLRAEGPLPLLAGLETLRGLATRNRKTALFLAFPGVYALSVSFQLVKNDRTVLTIIPFLAMLGGMFVDWVITSFLQHGANLRREALVTCAATLVVLLILSWPTWQAVQINQRFADDDVRTKVTQWMEAQLPPGSRIVGEYYSPLLDASRHEFRWVDRAVDLPIGWYRANADYVVLVENRYGGFYLDPARYPAQIAAYEAIQAQFALLKEFQGGALGNPCQAAIYRVGP